GDGATDGFAAVSDLDGAGRRLEDRGANGAGVLAARIVVGDDHPIGFFRGNGAHQWPLALVAVATGAEYDDEPVLDVGAECVEGLRQGVGLVRIVDENRRAVLVADALEPALGAFEMLER